MKEDEIKEYILNNKEKLPLSYHLELTYKKNSNQINEKEIESKIKKGSIAFKFFKSISRF